MADPLSIATSALSVIELCVRVGKYLRNVQETSKNVDEEVGRLEAEIETFRNAYTALAHLVPTGAASLHQETPTPVQCTTSSSLWEQVLKLVKEGHDYVQRLSQTLIEISYTESSVNRPVAQRWRLAMKLLSKEQKHSKLSDRLAKINGQLSVLIGALNLVSSLETRRSLDQLPLQSSQQIQQQVVNLTEEFRALANTYADVQCSIDSAKSAVDASFNQYFSVPRADTSVWTGRGRALDEIKEAFFGIRQAGDRGQRRFVVHGISGAGKTQLCCRFAQEYRASFRGVFWVDASSKEHARESWKAIAETGGKDSNADAGKYWLSNVQWPWLLLIDSADGSESSIEAHLPIGDRGFVLITTRNRFVRTLNTVGYLRLDELEEPEAVDLLRKTTEHQPWDESAIISASNIALHLGYLPLALIYAGRAICHGHCRLDNYISFFDQALSRLNDRRVVGTLNRGNDEDDDDDDDVDYYKNSMGAFTSLSIIYEGINGSSLRPNPKQGVSKDAIELINIIAFLHNQNLNLNVFLKAGTNLKRAIETKPSAENMYVHWSKIPFLQHLENFARRSFMQFMMPNPFLPSFLRLGNDLTFDESRVRKAIDCLLRTSLLAESSEQGIYSMHRLVHLWVKANLGLSVQALWCRVAGDVLASAIKIPPLVEEPGDQKLYVRMLTHLEQFRQNQSNIQYQLSQNRRNASYFGKILNTSTSSFGMADAINSAKYSRIYIESSMYSEASKLQQSVLDYVISRFGYDSVRIVPISSFLSRTLLPQFRIDEARKIQEHVLHVCRSKLGDKHSQTLKAMDALGQIYCQKLMLKEAKVLHESAIEGMAGREDLKRDRFRAMCNLSHVYIGYYECKQASELLEDTVAELEKEFGAEDDDTYYAKECLTSCLLLWGGVQRMKRANVLARQAYSRCIDFGGEEHMLTLVAAISLTRSLNALSVLEDNPELLEESKEIFEVGLEIARRNLGPKDLGTLTGRMYYAETLIVEKKYEEAEKELRETAELQKNNPGSREGVSRDRLISLPKLVFCYEAQGKWPEAIETCSTIIHELEKIGGVDHKLAVKMRMLITDFTEKMSQPFNNEAPANPMAWIHYNYGSE